MWLVCWDSLYVGAFLPSPTPSESQCLHSKRWLSSLRASESPRSDAHGWVPWQGPTAGSHARVSARVSLGWGLRSGVIDKCGGGAVLLLLGWRSLLETQCSRLISSCHPRLNVDGSGLVTLLGAYPPTPYVLLRDLCSFPARATSP